MVSFTEMIEGKEYLHLVNLLLVHLQGEPAHHSALLGARERLVVARDEDELLEDAAVRGGAAVGFLDDWPEYCEPSGMLMK